MNWRRNIWISFPTRPTRCRRKRCSPGSPPSRACSSAPRPAPARRSSPRPPSSRRCTPARVAYYTTPLIALTEQKFHEMQAAAVRWGFSARRRRPRHRQPPRQSERPRPGRRRRDSAQPPAAPRRVRLRATSPPSSWTSSTASPTRSAASSGNCRWACCRSTSACCCSRRRSATPLSSSTGWSAATAASSSWSRARSARCRSPTAGSPDEFLDEQLVVMAKGERRGAEDAGPGLLLQPRRMLERGRAAQGARPADAGAADGR